MMLSGRRADEHATHEEDVVIDLTNIGSSPDRHSLSSCTYNNTMKKEKEKKPKNHNGGPPTSSSTDVGGNGSSGKQRGGDVVVASSSSSLLPPSNHTTSQVVGMENDLARTENSSSSSSALPRSSSSEERRDTSQIPPKQTPPHNRNTTESSNNVAPQKLSSHQRKTRKTIPVLCRFALSARGCTKEDCEYPHEKYNATCHHWKNYGECHRGSRCAYLHTHNLRRDSAGSKMTENKSSLPGPGQGQGQARRTSSENDAGQRHGSRNYVPRRHTAGHSGKSSKFKHRDKGRRGNDRAKVSWNDIFKEGNLGGSVSSDGREGKDINKEKHTKQSISEQSHLNDMYMSLTHDGTARSAAFHRTDTSFVREQPGGSRSPESPKGETEKSSSMHATENNHVGSHYSKTAGENSENESRQIDDYVADDPAANAKPASRHATGGSGKSRKFKRRDKGRIGNDEAEVAWDDILKEGNLGGSANSDRREGQDIDKEYSGEQSNSQQPTQANAKPDWNESQTVTLKLSTQSSVTTARQVGGHVTQPADTARNVKSGWSASQTVTSSPSSMAYGQSSVTTTSQFVDHVSQAADTVMNEKSERNVPQTAMPSGVKIAGKSSATVATQLGEHVMETDTARTTESCGDACKMARVNSVGSHTSDQDSETVAANLDEIDTSATLFSCSSGFPNASETVHIKPQRVETPGQASVSQSDSTPNRDNEEYMNPSGVESHAVDNSSKQSEAASDKRPGEHALPGGSSPVYKQSVSGGISPESNHVAGVKAATTMQEHVDINLAGTDSATSDEDCIHVYDNDDEKNEEDTRQEKHLNRDFGKPEGNSVSDTNRKSTTCGADARHGAHQRRQKQRKHTTPQKTFWGTDSGYHRRKMPRMDDIMNDAAAPLKHPCIYCDRYRCRCRRPQSNDSEFAFNQRAYPGETEQDVLLRKAREEMREKMEQQKRYNQRKNQLHDQGRVPGICAPSTLMSEAQAAQASLREIVSLVNKQSRHTYSHLLQAFHALGLPSTAGMEAVVKRYRVFARVLHPDKAPSFTEDQSLLKDALEAFKRVSEAKEFIKTNR